MSISSVLNPDDKEDDDFTNTENRPRTPFDQEKLKAVMKTFVFSLRKEGRDSLASTLKESEYEIKDDFLIHAIIGSTLQKASLDKNKLEIISFLRRKLENWGVELSYEVIEKENSDDITLMTSVDKFKLMSKENPELVNFQKIFKLDVDF